MDKQNIGGKKPVPQAEYLNFILNILSPFKQDLTSTQNCNQNCVVIWHPSGLCHKKCLMRFKVELKWVSTPRVWICLRSQYPICQLSGFGPQCALSANSCLEQLWHLLERSFGNSRAAVGFKASADLFFSQKSCLQSLWGKTKPPNKKIIIIKKAPPTKTKTHYFSEICSSWCTGK